MQEYQPEGIYLTSIWSTKELANMEAERLNKENPFSLPYGVTAVKVDSNEIDDAT